MMSDEETKSISVEIAIEADADAVWRAVSEGEELQRWFPLLDARVTPGVGGAVWLSWGEGADWESPIEIWEPGRHLRTADPAPSKLAVDYYIEARGGETILRLVHSGFAADAWEDEIDTTTSGWRAFLFTMKQYLEHHRGEPRTLVYFRHPVVPLERPEAWRRMLTAFGLPLDAAAGDRYSATAQSGDRFEGVIEVCAAPVNLTATLENRNDGVVTIEIEPGRGQCRPAVWISLYGDAAVDADALQGRIRDMVAQAFPASSFS